MGLIGGSCRMNSLLARHTDLETQLNQLNTTKVMYGTIAAQSSQNYADQMAALTLTPDSTGNNAPTTTVNGTTTPVTDSAAVTNQMQVLTAQFNANQSQYGQVNSLLDELTQNISTQHKAVETEMDQVQKIIDKSIERGFKTLG